MERRSFALAAALGGALLAGVPSLSHAQAPARPQPRSLGDLFNLRPGGREQAPPVGRYVAENVGFTFDRSNSAVRFDGGREIIVLMRQAAPQGGVIYFNDVGEPVLKMSGLGGMTLFTPDRPQGVPVQFVATASPIQLETVRATQLYIRMREAANRMSRLMGREVGFDAADIGPESAALCWDVVNHTLLAYERNAGRERARVRTARVHVIEIAEGKAAEVRLSGDVLRITIAPERGLSGRPSSEKIARTLAR